MQTKLEKENDAARSALESYITNNGVKLQFFAKRVGIPLSTLSKWKHRKKELKEEKLERIFDYINGK